MAGAGLVIRAMGSKVLVDLNGLQFDIRRVLEVIEVTHVGGLVLIFDIGWMLDRLLIVVNRSLLGSIMSQIALLRSVAAPAYASFVLAYPERSLRI